MAELCGVTRARVRQLLAAGSMRGEKPAPTLWLIRRDEAERFIFQPPGPGRPRTRP